MMVVRIEAGEAMRRGALLAINEINKSGGVFGRPLELVVRDHRGNPARGVDNIESLASPPILALKTRPSQGGRG